MDAGMDANNGRQILLRVNLIRIATRCSSHGCPAVFRDSQQVPQRRTDALFSRLSLGCQVLARSTAIDNCFSFLFFSLAGKRDLKLHVY
jgi:hypothetical protein